ncbi:hypothetical protein [Streptomyces sp. NPDC004680]|uniref:hypothetical protein n=1 Tax=Streptomyces sp. NPDC004680 TaxID=3154287 RepID=UPI0033B98923
MSDQEWAMVLPLLPVRGWMRGRRQAAGGVLPYIDAHSEALVFREENQGACSWGVLLKDLDQADPPIHVLSDLADRQAQRWEPWMERLSWMAVEMVLAESLHAPQHLSDFLYEPDPEYTRILEESCEQLSFPTYPARGFEGTRWFLGADVLLRDEEGYGPVRARTEEALEAVRALLPGDWLNGYRLWRDVGQLSMVRPVPLRHR